MFPRDLIEDSNKLRSAQDKNVSLRDYGLLDSSTLIHPTYWTGGINESYWSIQCFHILP